MKRDNSHNEFVGNFNSFFDNESSLTGLLDIGGISSPPISNPTPPKNLTLVGLSAGPKNLLTPAISFVSENTPKYRCKITPPYYIRDDINGTILDYTKCPKKTISVGVSAGPTPPSSGSGTTTTTGGGGGTVSDTASTSSNESETATEQKPSSSEVKKTEAKKEGDCQIDYMKIFAFSIIGVIIGYFIAKKLKKDVKTFCIIGGIINAIIGYLFSKNKCK